MTQFNIAVDKRSLFLSPLPSLLSRGQESQANILKRGSVKASASSGMKNPP